MKKIILITGGQRSGKSAYAERLALSLSQNPVYIATAHVWDEEFRQRVARHQERRGQQWENIEEEKWLSRHIINNKVAVIDCITLWCTNFFYNHTAKEWEQPSVDDALREIEEEFGPFHRTRCHFHLRDKRDRKRRSESRQRSAPLHRPAGVDEPVCGTTCRRGNSDGERHSR